jgi:hypothetical protein
MGTVAPGTSAVQARAVGTMVMGIGTGTGIYIGMGCRTSGLGIRAIGTGVVVF